MQTKFFRYLVFLSIFSFVFLAVYRGSQHKGFRRLMVAFKLAVIITAVKTGFINSPDLINNNTDNPTLEPTAINKNYQIPKLYKDPAKLYDDTVLFVGRDSTPTNGPNTVPTAPSQSGWIGGTNPSKRPPGSGSTNPYRNPYRMPPKAADRKLGGGAVAGGAGQPGGGGNNGGDDWNNNNNNKNYNNQKGDGNVDDSLYVPFEDKKSKKKSNEEDQCPINQVEVKESFRSHNSLRKASERALRNQDLKNEYTRIKQRVSEGVDPMKIGRGATDLGENLTYVRGRHGRYIIKDSNGVKDFVGIAYRGSKNDMRTLATAMNNIYNVNIEPGGY